MAFGYVQTLAWDQGVDGPALSNTTTPTSILNASGKWTMPGNYFGGVGSVGIGSKIRASLTGRISTLTAAPGTLTLDCRIGTVIVFTGGAIALNVVAKTNVLWTAWIDLSVRVVGGGTTAAILGTGWFSSEAVIGTAVPATGPAPGQFPMPASAPAVGTGFDSSTAALFDIFATWSVASASNSIQVHNSMIESLN